MAGLDMLMAMVEKVTGGGSDSKTEIIEYLKEKGYSDEAVAGIVANIEVETGGSFDYKQQEKGKGKGEGLFQYTGSMKDSYNKWRKSNNKSDNLSNSQSKSRKLTNSQKKT